MTNEPDLVSWGAHANLSFDEMLEKLYDTSFIEKVCLIMEQFLVSTSLYIVCKEKTWKTKKSGFEFVYLDEYF